MKPESLEGFVCVRERITVVQNGSISFFFLYNLNIHLISDLKIFPENIQIQKLINDETFMMETSKHEFNLDHSLLYLIIY